MGFPLNVACFLVCDSVRMGPNLVKEVPVELAILADFWKAKWVKEGDPNIFNYTLYPFLKNIGIAFHRNLPKRPPLHNGYFWGGR